MSGPVMDKKTPVSLIIYEPGIDIKVSNAVYYSLRHKKQLAPEERQRLLLFFRKVFKQLRDVTDLKKKMFRELCTPRRKN